ncbi:hypothetical protein [Streptomyces sp. NPDC003710]
MTQSGQGEEPSARPAREGIVLPSDGGEPLLPGMTGGTNGSTVPAGGHDGQAAPAGGQSWGQPWGPGQAAQTPPAQSWGGADAGQSWGAQQSWEATDPRTAWGTAPAPQQGAGPLPPEGAQPSPYGTHGQPGAQAVPHQPPSAPLPPADEGATQYIPPVTPAPDEGATQFLPPAGAGALPPEMPADDATRFLGRAGAMPSAAGPDAQATQYLPPVPGQPGPAPYGAPPAAPGAAGQPPAEFDNLFRDGSGGAESTQHLPRFDAAGAPGVPAGWAPEPGGGDEDRGRTRSRIPLLAGIGVGIVVLGIGAGALLSGGGGDGKDNHGTSVAATGPATDSSSSPADPAKAQAVALDKLLADSGNSRGTVIKAVADVKGCQNLDQAAGALRDAAKQRNDLVTRLSGLAVDKLPGHGELTAALTNAWKASAAADTHYAAWADQVSGNKKGCKKGQARTTGQTAAGNRASGTASAQKAKAAGLWNAIAQQYGLTQRQPTQL